MTAVCKRPGVNAEQEIFAACWNQKVQSENREKIICVLHNHLPGNPSTPMFKKDLVIAGANMKFGGWPIGEP